MERWCPPIPEHNPFDLQVYKTKIISSIENVGDVKTFSEIVNGQNPGECARTFYSVLELATSGVVEIIEPEGNEEFPNSQDFTLKLLRTTLPEPSSSSTSSTEDSSRK